MIKTKQVFISYAKQDAQFAHRLSGDLRRLGVQVWIAPESILGGEGWVSAIERGLEESSHMVVVLTPAALTSKWVKKETDVAIAQERKGRIQIIPLDVEPCKVPLLLSSYQMVSFRRDYDVGLSQLTDILDVGVTSPEPVRPPRHTPPQYPSSKDPAEFVHYVIGHNRIDLVDAHAVLDVAQSPQHGCKLILWLSVKYPDKASEMIEEIAPQLLVLLSDSPQDVRNLFSNLEAQSVFVGKLLASKTSLEFDTNMMGKSRRDWEETQLILQRLQAKAELKGEIASNQELWVYDFFEHFEEADLSDRKKPHCTIYADERLVSGGTAKQGIFQHPPPPVHGPSRLPYRPIRIPDHIQELRLDFFTGILDERPDTGEQQVKFSHAPFVKDAVKFGVRINGKRVKLPDSILNSVGWVRHSLPVELTGGELTVEFITDAMGDNTANWAAWGEPRLVEIHAVRQQNHTHKQRPSSKMDRSRDFFISYNSADCQWAEWIAWQLEEAGYTTVLQAWDFRPGSNFVLEMQRAASEAERTIAVLSQAYLNALYTQPEWAAAFGRDPTGKKGTLLPVRVQECDLEGLLPQIVYVDLVGLDEAEAKDALLAGVRRERAKPTTPPGFPGAAPRSVPEQPRFPEGPPPTPMSIPSLAIGEWVQWGELALSVTRYETTYTCPGGYGRSAEGAKFVIIQVAARNVSNDVIKVPSLELKLNSYQAGLAGTPCRYNKEAFGNACYQGSGRLYPDVMCEGWILFEVPEKLALGEARVRISRRKPAGEPDIAEWRLGRE
jgi:hypothetical protein